MAKEHTPESIAANVRAAAARKRISQSTIAGHLGLNQQQVSRRLLGQVEFRATELQAIADLFDVSIESLYEVAEVPA